MNDLQIEYFLAVAETLSFTKTAAEKFVSQPAISKQIAAMEEELGVSLFERSYKSTKLTEAGRLFQDFFKRQRQDLSDITAQAKDTHKKRRQLLRVGIGGGWSLTEFMPVIIARLAKEHPNISISLESYDFHHLVSSLGEDEMDIIITLGSGLHASPAMEVHKLTEIPRVIVYSKAHPLFEKEALTPVDFRNEMFFVPAPDEAAYIVELVRSFCEPYGFAPKITGVKSIESLIVNVLNGLGVAITDLWTTTMHSGALHAVHLNTNHVIAVAWRRNNSNPAIPIFLHELARIFYPNGGCEFIKEQL